MTENSPIEEMFARNPLLAFSPYTSSQADTLRRVGAEILSNLDSFAREGSTGVEHGWFQRTYDLYWLWVLGAFEVARTMHGARDCFSGEIQKTLEKEKRCLALVRAPFAKQELAGIRQAVHSELSVTGIDTAQGDLFFTIDGRKHSVRESVETFLAFLAKIEVGDVVKSFEVSYAERRS